jgi:hypothetical protein
MRIYVTDVADSKGGQPNNQGNQWIGYVFGTITVFLLRLTFCALAATRPSNARSLKRGGRRLCHATLGDLAPPKPQTGEAIADPRRQRQSCSIS